MKICVSAETGSLEAQVDPRFGRCQYFVIVDSETMKYEIIENKSKNASSGAGIQAAQTVANHGAKIVITGNVGPNAFKVLSTTGIKIVTGAYGTVKETIEKYKRGELKETSSPTVSGHSGMGRGRGWRR
jgi:predicted Fe-Mo cluster-binding NifX family protein